MKRQVNFDLIAIDLDGTLLNSEGRITPRTRDAIERARAAGAEVVICTGRRFSSAMGVLDGVAFCDHMIVNNGIVVKEVSTGRTVFADYFPFDDYRACIRVLKDDHPDLPVLVMVDEHPEYEFCADVVEAGDIARRANKYHMEYVVGNARMRRDVATLEALPTCRIVQCCILHQLDRLLAVEERIAAATAGRADCFIIRNVKYLGSSFELVPRGASKWRALQFLADSSSIPRHRVMAIGDDLNDLAMIRDAGLGVAMANAVEAITQGADRVTADKDRDGVAEAIERYALGG